MIKAIVFDLGNVLIPFDYQRAIENFNKLESGLGEKFYKFAKDNYPLHREFEAGKITEDAFIATMLRGMNSSIDREVFCKFYSDIFTLNEDVISLLPILKNTYRLFLLSNTNSIHKKYGYEHYPFLMNFEKLFFSHEVGAVKPEKKFYNAVAQYSGLNPEEHIFIDDIEEYALGAKQQGWDAIQFKGFEQLKSELTTRGLL